jgi:carbamoyltransferase
MQLLGFYIGDHDSNLCALVDGRLRYRKFERLSGRKHQRVPFDKLLETCGEWGLRPDYVAFSDGWRNKLGICAPQDLFREIDCLAGLESANATICLDHHYAHALSGWLDGDRPESFRAVAVDGRGDHQFCARAFRIGRGTDASVLYEAHGGLSVGVFLGWIGERMGLSGRTMDMPGKLMGLQAYASPDEDFVAQHLDIPFGELPRRLVRAPFRGVVPHDSEGFFELENPDFLCWLASCHETLTWATVKLFGAVAEPGEPIEFTGGCAQNSVFNEVLAWHFPGFNVSCHPYDGGLSFGCLDFLLRMLDLPRPFVGAYPFLQDDEDLGFAEADLQAQVADLIAQGKVVGWMQGRGEVGPRALGHRSILFDPREPSGKDVINDRVKHREPWRPFAASVPLAQADEWFELRSPSPWMQRALVVRPERRAEIPGVVHVDGTCRAQTIEATDGSGLESFHGLIEQFAQRTGVPMVLNTSLNSGGEPIYGSRRQGEALLAAGRLDALCVGNELILR